MDVKVYKSLQITLNPTSGVFAAATEEGEELSDVRLEVLEGMIDRYAQKVRSRPKQALEPVALLALHERTLGQWYLDPVQFLGIVGGRSYTREARVLLHGQKDTLKDRATWLLHPDDTRVAPIKAHLQRLAALKAQMQDAERALKGIVKDLPMLTIPSGLSAEDARAEEPAWLEKLRAIQPLPTNQT